MFVLAVDGGGSETRVALVSVIPGQGLRLLAVAKGAAANRHSVGEEQAGRNLREAIAAAMTQAGVAGSELAACCLGVAGVGRAEDEAALAQAVAVLGLGGRYRIVNDAYLAWAGATLLQPGVVVVAGTGSIALAVDARGQTRRVGGWGPLLGDEGSGQQLGRAACQAVVRDWDGRGPGTALTASVLRHWNLDHPEQLVTRVYRPPIRPAELAALAPLVLEAAADGDAVAHALVMAAADELALTAATAGAGLALPAPPLVTTAGGLLRASFFRQAVTAALATRWPEARVVPGRYSPLAGGVLLALQQLGLAPEAWDADQLMVLTQLDDGGAA